MKGVKKVFMRPEVMVSVGAIMSALVFYTVGIWWEHHDKTLKLKHLILFWIGFCCDTAGTTAMGIVARTDKTKAIVEGLTSPHGITGIIAIILMGIHVVWATIVLLKKDERKMAKFHKFSIAVWVVWLIPYIIGLIMGGGH